MSIPYDLELENVQNTLQKRIKESKEKLEIYVGVRDALEPFDGKVINVRMKKAIQEALPEYHVSEYFYDQKNTGVCIWSDELTYHNAFYVRYFDKTNGNRPKRFDFGKLDEANPSALSLPEEIDNMQNFVKDVSFYVNRWNLALEILRSISDDTRNSGVWGIFNINGC